MKRTGLTGTREHDKSVSDIVWNKPPVIRVNEERRQSKEEIVEEASSTRDYRLNLIDHRSDEKYKRFQVLEVKETSNKDEIDNNVESIERNDKTEESLWTIELREDWYEITIGANDLIHVIGDTVATLKQSDAYKYCDTIIENEAIKETQQWQCSLPPFLIPTDSFPVIIEDSSHFIIDNLHNLLVLHPDCLITPTKISSSFPCPRRSVISSYFR
ncbi:hypothetical protein RFI_02767, partial [Reticulomyxa filosa]